MKKKAIVCGCLLFIFIPTLTWAGLWQDLWKTRDQQGATALQQGHNKIAAALFHSTPWQGVALYRSGAYEAAIDIFEKQNNSDGAFNAGNAYVHNQQYQEALSAYKKALSLNPENDDAAYNLKLVEQFLKQDPKSPPSNKKSQPNQPSSQSPPQTSSTKQPQKTNDLSSKQSVNTERQQQATEQWLRQIPDNPGGLLRQKFLRDHQRRQQARLSP
ncbi:MAG: tetratricopeptide repeat protein [Gammaproteobacteria bacterium]